jgi:replicative DNA helicase
MASWGGPSPREATGDVDHQLGLLSKIIHDSEMVTAINSRVTLEFFTDDKYRRVYEYLQDHWRKYGTSADLPVVTNAFPSYEWPTFKQSIGYFIDQLRQRRKEVILMDALAEAAQFVTEKDNPDSLDQLEATLRSGLARVRLETTPTFDVDFTQRSDEILRRLDERALDPGYLRGISTGVKGIDYVTGGLQAEQFIVIIGLPKAMKSSTLLAMAKNVHAQGKTVLFIGFEMSNDEQEDRLTSLYSNVGLTKVMNGTYNSREEKQITKALKLISHSPIPLITSVDMDSAMTVNGVQAKILEYQPDVVFIDGVYLMQSELPKSEPGSAQALADIARGLKRLAQAQRIPVVVTTQATETRAKGGRLTAASAMYTQAWRQSADVLLGVERDNPDAPDTGEVMVRFKVLASRSGPRAETMLSWDWSEGKVEELDPRYFKPGDDDVA